MARHGAPDWSKYRRDAATFSVEDLAEHAARLGSIDVFDRRGDVLFLENFEHGLGAWATGALGAGDSVAISPAWSRSGGYCALLTNGTSGADETTLTTAVHYPQLSLFGFESAVAFDAGLWRLHWDIRHYDGVHFHQFLVRYDYATKLLQVCYTGHRAEAGRLRRLSVSRHEAGGGSVIQPIRALHPERQRVRPVRVLTPGVE